MATQKRNALGRGLDALLSMDDVKTEGSSSINEIELAKITVNPNQPRREFDETALQELADSIAEIGIIQPITLRKLSDDEYQIIAGERRYRASQRAGLKTIPAYIRTADDENMMEMALIENIQREDLNAVEIALAYQHLLDQYELTQERLSERIGKKRTTIANYLRLLKLPAPIQMALQNKQLDMGHARALISLGDPKLQVKIFEEIQEHGYSVRKVEEIVKSLSEGEAVKSGTRKITPKRGKLPEEFNLLKQQLSGFFNTKVQLTCSEKGKGKKYQLLVSALLLCFLQVAGIDVYAQSTVTPARKDTTIIQREAPKARARRHRDPIIQDSVKKDSIQIIPSKELPAIDSLSAAKIQIADSLDAANKKELKKIEQPASIVVKTDTVPPPAQDINKKIFIPNPTKATWLAVVFPGGGQIYNRKYWKLPIIYGGFAGCAYALSWNGKMYKDYSQAYLDIMDSNPNTKSYEDLLPPNSTYNEEQLKNTLKRRKDMFRRYRDLSIFAFIGVYLISIIDAYVDAELSNFDITPDLSMKVEPAVIDNNNQFRSNSFKNKSVGLQCVLRF